jgi:hypothetical protein
VTKSIRKAGRQERISAHRENSDFAAGQGAIIKKVTNLAAVMDILGMKLLKRFAHWLESILAPHPKNESDDDWSRRIW